jgi:hypothetical protein
MSLQLVVLLRQPGARQLDISPAPTYIRPVHISVTCTGAQAAADTERSSLDAMNGMLTPNH